MSGMLLRVGIDSTCGQWNAPLNPGTGDFVYIPIPESLDRFIPGYAATYAEFEPALERFATQHGLGTGSLLPGHLKGQGCHLDPDFAQLTYGDQARGRGAKLARLEAGDFIAFYAALRPVIEKPHGLVYGLIGIFFIIDSRRVSELSEYDRTINAHTRREDAAADDLVLFADPSNSGRFSRCLPIGTHRNGAYRVARELLETWGGLTVRDGYLQRSASPPFFNTPDRFLRWLDHQDVDRIHSNN